MSAIGKVFGINPWLLGALLVVVFGAARTAWAEWTAAAREAEQADRDDFYDRIEDR